MLEQIGRGEVIQVWTTSQGTTDFVVFSSPMGVLHTLSWSFTLLRADMLVTLRPFWDLCRQ